MKISIAPMLGMTNRHCRYLHRLLTKHALLYTEMIAANAILNDRKQRVLIYNPIEHPVALQLAGRDPGNLAKCAKIAQERGYDEINLNAGCPSKRVRSGSFGACLMLEPELVAECIAAIQEAVDIPVTLKTRLGIAGNYSYDYLCRFIEQIAHKGCKKFIMHARLAYLGKVTPKQNRNLPPLQYEIVSQLQQDFPDLEFVLNGGLVNLQQVGEQLKSFSGVMIGQAAYNNPYMLATIDQEFYGSLASVPTRQQILHSYIEYIEEQQQTNRLSFLIRPILGIFRGTEGARLWRQHITAQTKDAKVWIETVKNSASDSRETKKVA